MKRTLTPRHICHEGSCRRRKVDTTKQKLKANSNENQSILSKSICYSIDSITLQPDNLRLFCISFLRQHFASMNILVSPYDISSILFKYLWDRWYWTHQIQYPIIFDKNMNFHFSSIEINNNDIFNNGQTVSVSMSTKRDEIKDRAFDFGFIIDKKMSPLSGIYTIKFKINYIGITNNNTDSFRRNFNKRKKPWTDDNLSTYIGWPSWSSVWFDDSTRTQYGLNSSLRWQTFEQYNGDIKYKSNNNYFKHQIACICNGDVLELQYDSNNNTLSFKKQNDPKLDACVYNLPMYMNFFWMLGLNKGGFSSDKVSITIVN